MKKQHAEHNEKACDFLLESKLYFDWVVTTAFYSALHFVQHEIFPIEIDSKDYDSFDDYFASNTKGSLKNISKHEATVNLVKLHIYSAYPSYKWLYDSCMSARYKNYNVSEQSAIKARERLTQLRAFLVK